MKKLKFKREKEQIKMLWKGIKPIFFKVKRRLDNVDIASLNKLCLDDFFMDRDSKIDLDRYDLFINIKIIFDTYVITKCTNLNFNSDEDLENFLNSKFLRKVTNKIYNYNETWNLIMQSITLKNTFVSLNLIRDVIPNTKKMEDNIKATVGMINELNNKNPQLLRKIVESNVINQQVVEEAREQNKSNKKTTKK